MKKNTNSVDVDHRLVVPSTGGDTDGNGLLTVMSKMGTDLIQAGAGASGNGLLKVKSRAGTDLIYAGASVSGNGSSFKATTRPVREWFSYPLTTTATA